MGGGVSVPEDCPDSVSMEKAKEILGDKFDEGAFNEVAEGGAVTRDQLEDALLIQMPEQAYTSVSQICDVARSSGVTGLLDLGSHPANEGEDLPAGLLYTNQLGYENPDLTGLVITQFRTKCNGIGSIDIALTLTSLKMLDMSECELTEISDGLGSLGALEELNLSENAIKQLPKTIGQLKNLKTLSMFKNTLSTLPDELGECTALEEVNFFNNKLIKLPKTLSALTELTELNVGGNKLKTLPPTDGWKKLETFSCHQNTLIMLPSFAGMTALTFLKMDYNKVLGELPDFGDGMTNLTHLEINHCAYSKLPASIGTMTAAKTVNCQGNQIDTCEADFSNLADLDTFNISSNGKLTSLPEGIGKCANLRVCFFQDTGVMSLPAEMGKFTKIERLMVPKSGLDSGAEEVLTALDSVAVTNGGWVKRL